MLERAKKHIVNLQKYHWPVSCMRNLGKNTVKNLSFLNNTLDSKMSKILEKTVTFHSAHLSCCSRVWLLLICVDLCI